MIAEVRVILISSLRRPSRGSAIFIMSKKRTRYNTTPLWVIAQLAQELQIPQRLIRQVPGITDRILGYFNPRDPEQFPSRSTKRSTATDLPIPLRTTTETEKKKKKRTRKSFNEGMYVGRFRGQKKRPSVWNGVSAQFEYGLNVADEATPDAGDNQIGCCWIGSTAIIHRPFEKLVLLSILREMVNNSGHDFNNGDELVQGTVTTIASATGQLKYGYRQNGDQTVVERSVDIGQTNKWNDVVESWYNDMNTTISNFNQFNFEYVALRVYDQTSGSSGGLISQMPLYNLNMRGLKIKFSCSSTMFVQNRTQATDGDDSAEVIDTNPLMGKIYVINDTYVNAGLSTFNPGVSWGQPTIDTGYIQLQPNNWTNAQTKQQFARPFHHKNIDRCYTSAKITLQPGEIKKNTVTFKDYVYFDTLFLKTFMPGLVANANSRRFPFHYGKSQLMAFEKVVRSGTATTSKIAIACTLRTYMTVEAQAVKKRPFIAENKQDQVAG